MDLPFFIISGKGIKMKIRNRIGCSTNCYHDFDLDTALRGISKAGFEYVELTSVRGYTEHIMPENMKPEDTKILIKKLKEYGLTPMSISGHSDLSNREGVDTFKRRLNFAKEIGVPIVNTGPGEVEDEAGKGRFLNNLHELANYAAELKVIVALETHGDLMGSGEKSVKVIKQVNSPWVRINYDTGNVIFYGGVKPEEDIKNAIPYIAHIHLKDKRGGLKVWDFPPLGMGEVNFPAIFEILSEEGYTGPISVEIEVVGKGVIPTWLVSDKRGEIVSRGEARSDPQIVDRALEISMEYLMKIINNRFTK